MLCKKYGAEPVVVQKCTLQKPQIFPNLRWPQVSGKTNLSLYARAWRQREPGCGVGGVVLRGLAEHHAGQLSVSVVVGDHKLEELAARHAGTRLENLKRPLPSRYIGA